MKDAAAAFRASGTVLAGLAKQIEAADDSAHPRFPGELSRGCGLLAEGLAILEREQEPYPELTALHAFPHAADGLEVLASALRSGAASLATLEPSGDHRPKPGEVNAPALGAEMDQLARELAFAAAAYHGVFQPETGTRTAGGWPAELVQGEAKLLASVYVEGASPLVVFSRLLVAKAGLFQQRLAGVFASIAAFLPLAATAYIPWHCHQECVGDGRLLGVSLSRTTSRRTNRVDPFWSQGGAPGILLGFLVGDFVAIQPQIYIKWDFCCYSICVLFWNNQYIESVETGPHDIGAPISGSQDANAFARARATTAAMLSFPRPPVPC